MLKIKDSRQMIIQSSQIDYFQFSSNYSQEFPMHQQNFAPYNQMGQVYEEDEYDQEESEALFEEVDADYEPTDKQVNQYAVEILGMSLPEDERFLYLAKEGLKAPIPQNWQPYQSRNGEIYYKHKITQQKTFEHPTDVQYKKKYIQEKERMARKNLKSMNLKGNPLGLANPLGPKPLPGLGSLGGIGSMNPLGQSNISVTSQQTAKLDPQFQARLQQQLADIEKKLEVQLSQFRQQREEQHENTMKKLKNNFQSELRSLKSGKSSSQNLYEILKEEKQKIKQRLDQAYAERLKDEIREFQAKEQQKLRNFQSLYQEDNQIKLTKYLKEREEHYEKSLRSLKQEQSQLQQLSKEKQAQRSTLLGEMRQRLQSGEDQDIQEATHEAFQKEIQKIKQEYSQKIKELQQRLENEYKETRKMLGYDPGQLFQELAEKKKRLKSISQQKLQVMKRKEYQKISQQYSQELEKSLKQTKRALETKQETQMQQFKRETGAELERKKRKLQEQLAEEIKKKVGEIYGECEQGTKKYEKNMNKQLSQIRQRFIQGVLGKSGAMGTDINLRLEVKEKEQMIQNKQELIESLKRQIQLQIVTLRQLKINQKIISSPQIQTILQQLLKDYGIIYKPEKFLRLQNRLLELKKKYKADKQLLGSMMNHLQKQPYDHNNYTSGGTSLLVKQYNKDVRIMRENEEILIKYELLLKKALLNDEQAQKQLQDTEQLQYKELEATRGLGNRENQGENKLSQIQNIEEKVDGGPSGNLHTYSYGMGGNSHKTVEDRLKEHGQFLNSMRNELNRKLYQVRTSHMNRF